MGVGGWWQPRVLGPVVGGAHRWGSPWVGVPGVFTYTNSNNTRGEMVPEGGGHPWVGVRVAPMGAGTHRRGRL